MHYLLSTILTLFLIILASLTNQTYKRQPTTRQVKLMKVRVKLAECVKIALMSQRSSLTLFLGIKAEARPVTRT